MNARISTTGLMLASFLVLQGCSLFREKPESSPPPPDIIEQKLDATLRVGKHERKVDEDWPPARAVYSWASTTVSYQGDALVFLKDVAQALGMRAASTGPAPYIPIYIRVKAVNEPLEDVLRRVAEQLGGRADVVLRDSSIEIRYR